MPTNYWDKVLSRRMTRRRALWAAGATTASAAFLAACGGEDDSPSGTGAGTGSGSPASSGTGSTAPSQPASSGLVTDRQDETDAAQHGGIFPYNHAGNVVSIDPHETFNAAAFGLITPVYSTMVKYGRALDHFPGADEITGDAMESWESTPDGLRVTYKLRPNHKFDHRPPTNGRAMTVEDVRYSWERVSEVSPVTADIQRSKSPTGMIDSFSFPDSNTVVVNLAEPYGALQEVLAYTFYFYIAPVEAEGGYDPQNETRGSGPFYLENFEPDIRLEYKRNPEWYEKDQPFLDGYTALFVTEVAQQEAQFEAGNLWVSGNNWNPETILRLKRDRPHLLMHALDVAGAPGQYPMLFGTRFASDVRLRRGASMLYDRAALIQAAYGTRAWEDAGLDVETYWDGHLANRAGEWIDPRTDELGEGAQYFQHNPAEAKKLFDAAGLTGQKLTFTIRASFGPTNVPEILHGMFIDGGLDVELNPIQANEWRDVKATAGAGFEDFFWSTANSYNADGFLATKYTPGGKDRVTPEAIPSITDMILKMRQELDNQRRLEQIKDIQRELAKEMPDMPVVSTLPVAGYSVTQPWLRNTTWTVPGFNAMGSTARPITVYWVDPALQAQYGG